MNYNEFKKTFQDRPIIFSRDVLLHRPDKQIIRNQLIRWQDRKLLIKLQKGVFLLNQSDRKINPSRMYLANQLYNPSYVSLEYALNYYGLIPEKVSDVTSITTKKTRRIDNESGVFIYRHIKPEAFRGFVMLKDGVDLGVFMAEPEKAIVDLCYLNLDKFVKDYKSVFREFYRFQNTEILKSGKILNFAEVFNNDKLMSVCKALRGFIADEKR